MRNAVLISFCKTRVHYDDMHRERKIFWTSNIMIRTSQYFLHTVRRTSASEFFFRTLLEPFLFHVISVTSITKNQTQGKWVLFKFDTIN